MIKTKKILPALMACTMAVAGMAISVSAEETNENATDLEPVVTTVATTETEPEVTTTTEAEPTTTVTTTTTKPSSPKTGQLAYAAAAIPVALVAGVALAKKKNK